LLAEDALLMLGAHELAAATASAERAVALGAADDSPTALAPAIALAATRLAAGDGDAGALRRARRVYAVMGATGRLGRLVRRGG